jgi:hypothetical protein
MTLLEGDRRSESLNLNLITKSTKKHEEGQENSSLRLLSNSVRNQLGMTGLDRSNQQFRPFFFVFLRVLRVFVMRVSVVEKLTK